MPALSVESLGPRTINQAAEKSCFGSLAIDAWPATQRWNDSQNSKLLAKELMVMLAIEAAVPSEGLECLARMSLGSDSMKLRIVRGRADAWNHAKTNV